MTKQNLIDCHNRIKPFIHNTPVLTSNQVNKMTGSEIYFKCDNFQKMGAFKMRGATNAILQLSDENKKNGVVTHSSGNFAQALSLAAKSIGVKAYIVMPSSATEIKKTAVKSYGGELIECEPNLDAREKAANDIAESTGATFLHPSNDIEVILGQGTACKELLEYNDSIEHVLVPIGGGGLIAGSALAAKYFGKNCTVIGAEPFEVDDAYRSLKSGRIETNDSTNTIADGLKTQLGDKNFPIIKNEIKSIIRITEEEIIESMKIIWERLKIICEPSCSLPLAAVLKNKETFKNKKVGIIISGGNVDLNNLPF
ncbi:MAG: pyridoxal-phosphate dependent enzyme [Cryomorphaceae bacterium]|nr:pyridoxal-phosphate dependent enzyme [Cryomorphaceae bacterium]MBT3503891.1 pyridoxal-phosphate dependent enzyme [Cryomorphaceae bacterium]MBT3689071.1 pyridoxal-phosphate dependent enzyme [Cryomorphaceae bacterium]MBT4221924.1 pyridoxal-phosphate dependent enzyme [Cryomorphaceae bacterium]MBT4237109.1 pyridoxal-phosphate dependent enzyme [Cryomorphaceae bacterium]